VPPSTSSLKIRAAPFEMPPPPMMAVLSLIFDSSTLSRPALNTPPPKKKAVLRVTVLCQIFVVPKLATPPPLPPDWLRTTSDSMISALPPGCTRMPAPSVDSGYSTSGVTAPAFAVGAALGVTFGAAVRPAFGLACRAVRAWSSGVPAFTCAAIASESE
jgi:hypothetical protein